MVPPAERRWRAVPLPRGAHQVCEAMVHQGRGVVATWAEQLTEGDTTTVWFTCDECHRDMLDTRRATDWGDDE